MKIARLMILALAVLFLSGISGTGNASELIACAKKNNGQFRVVSDADDCRPSEVLITFDIDDEDGELEGEMCWLNSEGDCMLRLSLKSQGTSYSLFGNEICDNGGMMVAENHVFGSGYINSENDFRFGLTYLGLSDPADPLNSNIMNEGRLFVMDLDAGFNLVQYMESGDATVEQQYTLTDCP